MNKDFFAGVIVIDEMTFVLDVKLFSCPENPLGSVTAQVDKAVLPLLESFRSSLAQRQSVTISCFLALNGLDKSACHRSEFELRREPVQVLIGPHMILNGGFEDGQLLLIPFPTPSHLHSTEVLVC